MALFAINSTSVTLFLYTDWFNISKDRLSTDIHVQTMQYTQCLSILESMSISTAYYGIFPCDIKTRPPTFYPTNEPSSIPTRNPLPTLAPSDHPTGQPSAVNTKPFRESITIFNL